MPLFKKTNPETQEITYFSDDKCITADSTESEYNTAKENATECKTEGGRRRSKKSKKSKKAKKTKKSKKSKKTKKSRKH